MTSLSSNVSSPPSPIIDPRFSFNSIYGDASLPKTPLFMNLVELMSQYAELGWTSRVGERHGVVLQSFPQVEMAILPAAPATSVENRLIIWGLWGGISNIIRRNKFNEVEIEIRWDDELVAYINLTRPLDLQDNGGNGTQGKVEKDLDPSLSLNETFNNGTSDGLDTLTYSDFDWLPRYAQGGKLLTPVEAFVTILAGLKNIAPAEATDKVLAPFTSSADGTDAHLAFYFHGRRSPRTKRPFFQYIHVIKSLRLIPGYFLDNRKFADLEFGIGIHGIAVAEGYMEKGPSIQGTLVSEDVLGFNSTISTS